MEKVVFAFSGTLENAISIQWLSKRMNMGVVAYSANLGTDMTAEPVGSLALEVGAIQAQMGNILNVFVDEFVFPALRANADYECGAFLACALSRPLIAREMVKIANEECSNYIAHGSRPNSNDELRFEAAVSALAPHITVLIPNRQITEGFRKMTTQFFVDKKLKLTGANPYSLVQNIWGSSVIREELANTWMEPKEEMFSVTKNPLKAPATPEYVELEFKAGLPIAVDGHKMTGLKIITLLNEKAGKYGIGRSVFVQPGINGNKVRTINESPAASVLFAAHRALEAITLERDVLKYQETISAKYRQMIYDGNWFLPLREALDAFFDHSQKMVTGKVRVRLIRGQCEVVGTKSPFSIYGKGAKKPTRECNE